MRSAVPQTRLSPNELGFLLAKQHKEEEGPNNNGAKSRVCKIDRMINSITT